MRLLGVRAQYHQGFLAHPFQTNIQRDENPHCHSFTLADETQQQMLGPHIVMPELLGFLQRKLQHFLCPAVKGMSPKGWAPNPAGMMRSTSLRTVSSVSPNLRRTAAATPSPSRIKPRSKCSVPTYSWLRRLASSLANSIDFRALAVNLSNIVYCVHAFRI